jgi:hypothetical protein
MVAVAFMEAVSTPLLTSGQSTWLGGLPQAIPEASSLALLIVGLAAVGVVVRRRNARLAAQGGDAGEASAGNSSAPAPTGPAGQG